MRIEQEARDSVRVEQTGNVVLAIAEVGDVEVHERVPLHVWTKFSPSDRKAHLERIAARLAGRLAARLASRGLKYNATPITEAPKLFSTAQCYAALAAANGIRMEDGEK